MAAETLSNILRLSRAGSDELLRRCASEYHSRWEPKPDGSFRRIEAPTKQLKSAQRRVLKWLAKRVPIHPASRTDGPRRGIIAYAADHAGKELVVRIDIQRFYPSVNFGRVRALLCRHVPDPELAAQLTRLCTRRRALPQGAPTSTLLGNAVLFALDVALSRFSVQLGATYSRWIDDLTFSASHSFAEHIPAVVQLVSSHGFKVAKQKTRIMPCSGVQIVGGLIVNAPRLALSTEAKSNALAACAALRNEPLIERRAKLEQIVRGHLAFCALVDPSFAAELRYHGKRRID